MTRFPYNPSRRQMMRSLLGGSIIMPAILSEMLNADTARGAAALDPLSPKPAMFPARAKRVIFMYMSGGCSHVDSFDYKPRLFSDAGKQINGKYLKRPNWEFSRHGQSGMPFSSLFPEIATCADELCMINSLVADHGDHFEATLGIHTGSVSQARPSIGSWVSYGLGTLNQNLPSFMAIAPKLPYAGGQVWSSDFLPPCHQGVRVVPGAEPIPDLRRLAPTAQLQQMQMGLLQSLNQRHLKGREADPALAARMRSFETAAGMQQEAPEAFDLSGESDATLAMYGLSRGSSQGFGWQCLVARRLAERGVRFVELIDCGSSDNWDAHSDMATHGPLARNVDRPAAALIKDLKLRGMLDDTLVVWTTEFGRTPSVAAIDGKGREHHPRCFSSWLAGGGIKRGFTYGSSDDFGIEPATNEMRVHDFHATILALLGLNHEKLTYRHAGRDFRLTDVSGNVVTDLIA